MKKKMIIDTTNSNETRMAVVQNDLLVEYESENSMLKPTRGNIYLAKIIRGVSSGCFKNINHKKWSLIVA